MQADYILNYDVLPINHEQKVHLMARFVTDPVAQDRKRRPLNLSLVIDRSGSMGGAKIDYTRQAAQFLVQNLSARDTLSIVLYNESVETLLMPENVKRKDVINQRIDGIKARGTTNLSSGWLEGCNLVAKNLENDVMNRVILMSDGLANRGVTGTEKLVNMARQKFNEQISTTTMGLGNDFNEDLLIEMANAGGGAYYFIESPEVAPTIFQEELSGLLNVIGQNLTISIEPTETLKVVHQLNAYPMSTNGTQMSFRLGDVFGEEVKALLLEFTLLPIQELGHQQIATLKFEYDELRDDRTEHQIIEVPVMVTVVSPDRRPIVVNAEVQQSVLLLQAAQARRMAVKAADKGQFTTAAQSLKAAADAIQEAQVDNPQLLEEQSALLQQAMEMEQGSTRYSEYSRKTMQTQAFYTMTSRHDDTVMLRVREQQHLTENFDPEKIATGNHQAVEPKPSELPHIAKQRGLAPSHVTWKKQTFTLMGDLIRIGRSQHNEIIIMAQGVSRFHAQIKRHDDKLLLEDLGSTNGTTIAHEQLDQPYRLSVGDIVYVCNEKLIFHDGSYNN